MLSSTSRAEQIQRSGRHEPGSRARRARYRTGIEGRISHLKRGYGLRRTRLERDDGLQIWTGSTIVAYDLDTLAIRTRWKTPQAQTPPGQHSQA